MKLLFFFLLAFSSTQCSSGMKIAVNKLVSIFDEIVTEISKLVTSESKQFSSLVEYQYGSVVNVPGEIESIPKLLVILINQLAVVKNAFVQFFTLLQHEFEGQSFSQTGPTIVISNGPMEPFISLIYPIENVFNSLISNIQIVGGIIQNAIIPLLTQTLQSNGIIIMPTVDYNALKTNVLNIFQELQNLCKRIQTAVIRSKQLQVSSTSIKGTILLQILDTFSNNLATNTNNTLAQGIKGLNNLPVQQIASSQDEVQLLDIVKELNVFLGQISQFIKTVHTALSEAKTGINFFKNPVGAALFNII